MLALPCPLTRPPSRLACAVPEAFALPLACAPWARSGEAGVEGDAGEEGEEGEGVEVVVEGVEVEPVIAAINVQSQVIVDGPQSR